MKNKSDISKMLNILNNLYVASLLYRECGMKGEVLAKGLTKIVTNMEKDILTMRN